MSRKVIQIAIEEELLAALDVRSQEEGRSRAEIIREACRAYLREQDQESTTAHRRGALALIGAWGDVSDAEIDKFIADVYAERDKDTGRPVDLGP